MFNDFQPFSMHGVVIASVVEVSFINAAWMVQLHVEPRIPVGVSLFELLEGVF